MYVYMRSSCQDYRVPFRPIVHVWIHVVDYITIVITTRYTKKPVAYYWVENGEVTAQSIMFLKQKLTQYIHTSSMFRPGHNSPFEVYMPCTIYHPARRQTMYWLLGFWLLVSCWLRRKRNLLVDSIWCWKLISTVGSVANYDCWGRRTP